VVYGGSPSGPQAVLEERALLKVYQTLNKWKIGLYMPVLKLPFLVNHQEEVGK
jgi:hypothetical protein